jgi:hypothetical protein
MHKSILDQAYTDLIENIILENSKTISPPYLNMIIYIFKIVNRQII